MEPPEDKSQNKEHEGHCVYCVLHYHIQLY